MRTRKKTAMKRMMSREEGSYSEKGKNKNAWCGVLIF